MQCSEKDLLVKVQVGFEVVDERSHLVRLAERQERDDPHQTLKHAGMAANKRTVDAIQQRHQLGLVARQDDGWLQRIVGR